MKNDQKMNTATPWKLWSIIPFVIGLGSFTSCNTKPTPVTKEEANTDKIETVIPSSNASVVPQLNDQHATASTKALYAKLHLVSQKGQTIFGHQDDLSYGYNWWAEEGRSDVKESAGDYPGLYGWDMGEITEAENLDHVNFLFMKEKIQEVAQRGGINTLSWHMINLKNNTNSWDTTSVVKDLLEGGALHEAFKERLDIFADFVSGFEYKGDKIPFVFRPWHEHTGSWFWWGKGNCSKKEYLDLWHFTVTYLRETKNVHNLIYVYSTDNFKDSTHYLERFPGDEYVDILGFDDYGAFKPDASQERAAHLKTELETVVQLANQKNKVPVFSETGLEALTDTTWFTEKLYPMLYANELTKQIAYVMVWRNANFSREQKNHFYAPYKGHAAEKDFISFKENPNILFEKEVKKLDDSL